MKKMPLSQNNLLGFTQVMSCPYMKNIELAINTFRYSALVIGNFALSNVYG